MNELLTPDDIERMARNLGKTMPEVCDAAGVAYTTFWRWRTERSTPSIDVYRRLVKAASPATGAAP
jgi:transcriptional regulator with XRE-family HTH domain